MAHHVGIDLGTTNSAICSFDGQNLHLYKSPEQADVTPSAILYVRRGNRRVGQRAYDSAPLNPDAAALLFKRFMGTSTPIKLPAVGLTLRPEECAAEILRVLFGYLPDEIRNSSETGTVITVPAAFNQMQKQATMAAAEMAEIGRVALMQEPVAAVMSVMHARKGDGAFLVYDLGGGTFDVALAECTAGHVNLLAHGGIEMCGGRDFDRLLVDNVVRPWLRREFDLPDDFLADPAYRTLHRLAAWAAEKAKVALSARENAVVSLDESEIRLRDRAGADIHLDVPIVRANLDRLIWPLVDETIRVARETLEKAGMGPHDVERVVFVGGPTRYGPLRERVAFELGIAASTEVDPMIAVAQGAALFAESIDWSSETRGRKSSRGRIAAEGPLDIGFQFVSRTPDDHAKVAAIVQGSVLPGAELQIDSLDTGWSSGRVSLRAGAAIEVPLARSGDNTFRVFVFDGAGGPVRLAEDRIVIVRTMASVDAIPASHSIGIEVRDAIGGRPVLDYLVREGDALPHSGRKLFKAEESLRAGGVGSLRFKLWEGEIRDPVTDNRFIGLFEISGRDFDEGVIAAGAELVFDYTVLDSGSVAVEVAVPSIGASFPGRRNYYSRQEAEIDYTRAARRVADDATAVERRRSQMAAQVEDDRLDLAERKLAAAAGIDPTESDPETAKRAMDDVHDAKRLLAQVRQDNLRTIRRLELDQVVEWFGTNVRRYAKPAELDAFDATVAGARRAIESNRSDFESHMSELWSGIRRILWRQEWFVVDHFKRLAEDAHLFDDTAIHAALVRKGQAAIDRGDVEGLRAILREMAGHQLATADSDDMLAVANILRGG